MCVCVRVPCVVSHTTRRRPAFCKSDSGSGRSPFAATTDWWAVWFTQLSRRPRTSQSVDLEMFIFVAVPYPLLCSSREAKHTTSRTRRQCQRHNRQTCELQEHTYVLSLPLLHPTGVALCGVETSRCRPRPGVARCCKYVLHEYRFCFVRIFDLEAFTRIQRGSKHSAVFCFLACMAMAAGGLVPRDDKKIDRQTEREMKPKEQVMRTVLFVC